MSNRRLRGAKLGKFRPQATKKRRARQLSTRLSGALELIDLDEEQLPRMDDTPPTKRVRFNIAQEVEEVEEDDGGGEEEDASRVYDRLHIIEEGDEVSFRLAIGNGSDTMTTHIALGELHRTIISEAERTPPDMSDGLLMNKLVQSVLSDSSAYQENAKRQLIVLTALVAIDPFSSAVQQNKMLRLFYESCVPSLQARLRSCAKEGRPLYDESTQICCQLEAIITTLGRLVDQHRVYMRQYVIEKDLLTDVVVFLHSNRLTVALAALEMFQRILQQENADYTAYIRRVNALAAVERCWEANGEARTALYSALIEFFGYAMKTIHQGNEQMKG